MPTTAAGWAKKLLVPVTTVLFIAGLTAYLVIVVLILSHLSFSDSDVVNGAFAAWPALTGQEAYLIFALPPMVVLAEVLWLRGGGAAAGDGARPGPRGSCRCIRSQLGEYL